MNSLLVLSALLVMATAFKCPPNACDNVEKANLENCKGGVLRGVGFCGCHDVCAKVENEECSPKGYFMVNSDASKNKCDKGLYCVPNFVESTTLKYTCVKPANQERSKRLVCTEQLCAGVKQEELTCQGSVIKVGFCGCKKVCAKQSGEMCQPERKQLFSLFGIQNTNEHKCDQGLSCQENTDSNGEFSHVCM